MLLLQTITPLVGQCLKPVNESSNTFQFNICVNGSGIRQTHINSGSTVSLGSYVGWSNTKQQGAFSGGDLCTLPSGLQYPRSAYLQAACHPVLEVTVSEPGEPREAPEACGPRRATAKTFIGEAPRHCCIIGASQRAAPRGHAAGLMWHRAWGIACMCQPLTHDDTGAPARASPLARSHVCLLNQREDPRCLHT